MAITMETLVGEHVLTGIDYECKNDVRCVIFCLDGVNYCMEEDPDDGYRSYAREIKLYGGKLKNTFPAQTVTVEKVNSFADDLMMIISKYNTVILTVGTTDTDDCYPCAVFRYHPENMEINRDSAYKNCISALAIALGVEVGEGFDILYKDGTLAEHGPYKLVDNGLRSLAYGEFNNSLLMYLICGGVAIVKLDKNWWVKDGGAYWCVASMDGTVIEKNFFMNDVIDYAMLNIGNCFPTRAAAEDGKNKVLAKAKEIRKELQND